MSRMESSHLVLCIIGLVLITWITTSSLDAGMEIDLTQDSSDTTFSNESNGGGRKSWRTKMPGR